jgi:hypothetical protein
LTRRAPTPEGEIKDRILARGCSLHIVLDAQACVTVSKGTSVIVSPIYKPTELEALQAAEARLASLDMDAMYGLRTYGNAVDA